MYYLLRTISMFAVIIAVGPGHVTFSRPMANQDVDLTAVATDAVAVIRAKHSTPLDKYLLLVCSSKEQSSLLKDSDAGVFVRYMAKIKSNLFIMAMPAGMGDGPAFCVYFNGRSPLGIVAFPREQAKTMKDEMVEKAYTAVSGTVPTAERRPVLEKGEANADDGTPIPMFQVTGWK